MAGKTKGKRLSRSERKEAKSRRKAELKTAPPKVKWAHRGKKLLKVLLAIAASLLLLVAVVNISYCAKQPPSQEPHPAAAQYEQKAQNSILDQEMAAYLKHDPNELYVSQEGIGQSQTRESFKSQEVAWGPTYDGTDPHKIMTAYCMNCHIKEEVGPYRVDEETARAKVMSMVNDYGCTQLTPDQIDALVEFYTERSGR